MSFFNDVILTFVPLLVAIDALGSVPVILSLTHGVAHTFRVRMVNIAILTASMIGIGFLFLGKSVLNLLDISVDHFAIAGGMVLLILALRELTGGSKLTETPDQHEMLEIVPIGTPMLAGPATITTLLLLDDRYPSGAVLAGFALNLAFAWIIFTQAPRIASVLGRGGLIAMSKIASLLLTAIAVRLMLDGIKAVFSL